MSKFYKDKHLNNYSTSGKKQKMNEETKVDKKGTVEDDTQGTINTGDVDDAKLIPCLATYCCIISQYYSYPSCFGCACRNNFCCGIIYHHYYHHYYYYYYYYYYYFSSK